MKQILFILCVFIPGFLLAQPKTGQALVDSFVKELNSISRKNKEDTLKLAILDSICYGYYNIDPDKGIQYSNRALQLAEKLNRRNQVAQAYYFLAANYCVKSNFPGALDNWLKGLRIFEELGDKRGSANSLSNVGRIFFMQNNIGHALEYFNRALSLFEQISDTAQIAKTMGDIGSAYLGKKDYVRALEYYKKALETNRKLNIRDVIADNTGNIGAVYMEQKEFSLALEYLFMALKMNEELGDKSNSAINIGNIGYCYLAIAKDTSGKIKKSGLIPAGKGANLKNAITYLNRSIALCRETGNLDELQDRLRDLSDAEFLAGNYKSALENYRQFVAVRDSVYNTENNVKITNLETKRDLDLKQKDLEIQSNRILIDKLAVAKKRNERGYFVAGLCLLGCIIVVIFRNYKNQQKSNVLLTESNSMLTSEKKRSDDLLRNILPSEVAEELKNKGNAEARLFDNVTVLFTDFVNFTAMSESLSPTELVRELDSCFKSFDEITGRYNIEKIKTIGDAYLAVAGLPKEDPMHAQNIVRAALDISAFMRERLTLPGVKTFEVRIGVHSGSVVAGIVGVKKFAYDIWGDTVNTAARMEQHSEAGKVNISQTTYELVKDKFACTYRGEIEVKGKGQLRMYYV